jgi:hypothetical protein
MFILWPKKNSNYGTILGGPGDKGKVVNRVPRSIFFPFYRKGLIGVWYCNLRNPVKAIFPGLLRDMEAKPPYKER